MKSKFLFVLLLALSSISFFKPVLIDPLSGLYNYTFGLLLIISAIAVIKNLIDGRRSGYFSLPVIFLLLSIIIATLNARIFWGLDTTLGFFGTLFKGIGYFSYFYLSLNNIAPKVIEKIIIVLGIAFIIIFLISFVIYPQLIVYYNEVSGESAVQRIFVNGDGFLFLFYFFCLNKYKSSKSFSWLVLLLLGFLCVLLNQTRVYLAATFIITIFYILQSTNFFLKILIIASCIAGFLYISQASFFQVMQKRTQADINSGNSNIRLEAADYFLSDFQPSVVTQLLGNGVAYGDDTDYSKYIARIRTNREYFIEDLGFVGLYIYFGIIAIIAYLIIFYKAFKAKLLPDYAYARMFVVFLLFAGFTTSTTYNSGFIIPIVFAIYLLEKGINPLGKMTPTMIKKILAQEQ